MRGFQFSLERLLSWRRAELRIEEAGLTPLVAESRRLGAARLEMAGAIDHAQLDLLSLGPVDGAELEALAHYRARLEKQKTIVDQEARHCQSKSPRGRRAS
jgi:hypothetical protein